MLGQRYAEAAWAYHIAGTVFVVGCICSVIVFAWRMRVVSFATMCLTAALTFACCWTILGQTPSSGGRAFALVEQFNARLIGDNDRITWAIGRPDARIMYYLGTQVHPLFSPLEVAPLRENRRDIPAKLMEEGARRLERLLSSEDVEAYVIIDAVYWDARSTAQPMSGREVFRVGRPGRKPSPEDWVVVTNEWNTGEWEDLLPAATERAAKLPALLEPRFGVRPGGK